MCAGRQSPRARETGPGANEHALGTQRGATRFQSSHARTLRVIALWTPLKTSVCRRHVFSVCDACWGSSTWGPACAGPMMREQYCQWLPVVQTPRSSLVVCCMGLSSGCLGGVPLTTRSALLSQDVHNS